MQESNILIDFCASGTFMLIVFGTSLKECCATALVGIFYLGFLCSCFIISTDVIIQVETVAQFGVIFLLFALGLEFSTAKVCF